MIVEIKQFLKHHDVHKKTACKQIAHKKKPDTHSLL